MSTKSHAVNQALYNRLPDILLLTWALLPFYADLGHSLVSEKLTVDVLCSLVANFASPFPRFKWCGHLACRFCLRQLKQLPLSRDGVALLQFITCVIFRLRNEGPATCCYFGIDNAELEPLLTIASKEEAHAALKSRGRDFEAPSYNAEVGQIYASQTSAVCSQVLPRLPISGWQARTPHTLGQLQPGASVVDPPSECNLGPGRPTVVLHFAEGSRPSLPTYFTPYAVPAPLPASPQLAGGLPCFDPFAGPATSAPAARPTTPPNAFGTPPRFLGAPPGIKRQRAAKSEVSSEEQSPRQRRRGHDNIGREGWKNLGYDSEDISSSD